MFSVTSGHPLCPAPQAPHTAASESSRDQVTALCLRSTQTRSENPKRSLPPLLRAKVTTVSYDCRFGESRVRPSVAFLPRKRQDRKSTPDFNDPKAEEPTSIF